MIEINYNKETKEYSVNRVYNVLGFKVSVPKKIWIKNHILNAVVKQHVTSVSKKKLEAAVKNQYKGSMYNVSYRSCHTEDLDLIYVVGDNHFTTYKDLKNFILTNK